MYLKKKIARIDGNLKKLGKNETFLIKQRSIWVHCFFCRLCLEYAVAFFI